MLHIKHIAARDLIADLQNRTMPNHPSRVAYIYEHISNANLSAYCYKKRQDDIMSDMSFVFKEEILVKGRLGASLRIVSE